MFSTLLRALRAWNTQTTERQKLQHAYVAAAVVMLMAAGVIGLLNYELGQQLLAVSIGAGIVFLLNAVAWALLQSFVLLRLGRDDHTQSDTSKKQPRK